MYDFRWKVVAHHRQGNKVENTSLLDEQLSKVHRRGLKGSSLPTFYTIVENFN
jgi:hypothetical protein